MSRLILAAALVLALGAGAAAQTRARAPAKPPEKEAPPPPPADLPAPYDRDLLRLSEILGALGFLRDLCGQPDAAEWPARMQALIEAEGGSQARRDRLAGAYNRGYRGYAVNYRTCTASAREAATRFLAEGERLSVTLSGRFGG
ncbi:TIGR02301 family protein [Methylobacterium oryzihabitans]|uniref:TIGR02301 family protein n=1 Tax=Methylobacterium oryzihabitans TaxID=2499852 RepID=A0A3S3U788_9HYPH|nr:TIGR02301 family protein [Methylobacterium oryzihabitans]RVU17167.1 TIGR02301 family protein [Methylobacterium oryzihabitans]